LEPRTTSARPTGLRRGLPVDGFLRLHTDLRDEKVTHCHNEQGTQDKGSAPLEHRQSPFCIARPSSCNPQRVNPLFTFQARGRRGEPPGCIDNKYSSGIYCWILVFRLLIIEARILNSHLAFFYFKVFLLLPPHLIFTLYDHLGRHCQRVRSSPWPRRKYIL